MTVFKIYIHGISDGNMIFRSDVPTRLTEYGDSILSPKLKKETNKADSFEFIILPNNDFYDTFEKKKTFVYLTRDGKCIFRGRVSDIKTDIFKQRTISCEGDLAFLSDSVQSPNKKNNTSNAGSTKKQKNETVYSHGGGEPYTNNKDLIKMSPEEYFRTCIDVHNGQMTNSSKKFTVGSVTVSDKSTVEYFERTGYQDTSSTISGDLLSVYGGLLRTRYENGQAYIDWLDAYTDTNDQQIRFGVNMIDLDQEPPTDETWSVLLPTGEENCTIASVNNGSKFLENSSAIDKYGYIVHHHAFSNVKKPDKLLEKARKYMSTHCKVFPNNLIVKAIDLQLIGESNDPLEIGDKIQVVSSPHGLNKTMACIAMELDIYNPENNSYTIGTIMPPDKEKKKEPLSEKHRSSHNSSARGIGNNANAISGLQNDVNVNANNINVNAENIAVNALNIAVNAENIAVVAKNISIAAETIDVKAQEITVALGEESDELYGHITATAEGIKTEFHDNTTGLSSYFSQEAGKITAAVENAEGNIRSKIELTESSLTSQFNTTIYGENGIVNDYEGKITQTSTQLTSDYTAKITNTKSEITREYEGKITQSATSLTSDYTAKIENAKTQVTEEYESKIQQTAESINLTVSKKVGKDEVISSINQTAESITISASKVNLNGYVTASQLQTTNANITNLINGNTTASYILATKMKVATGNFYIGDSNNQSGELYYHGSRYYDVTISMPNVASSTGFLGWVYKNGSYPTSLSLAHSHSVTTNSDGTITLGGTVATDSPVANRSFRIADTKAYKDGVSAISVTSVGLNTTDYEGSGIGTEATSNTPIYYTSSNYNYHVRVRADASNGNHRESRIDFSGALAYNDGVDSVSVSSIGRQPDGEGGVISDTYNSSTHNTTVHVRATASNGKTKDQNISVSGANAYKSGKNDESIDISSWSVPQYSSAYPRQMVAVSDNNDGVRDCVTFKVTVNKTGGGTVTHTFQKIPCWDVYDYGVDSVSVISIGRRPNGEGGVMSDAYNTSTNNITVYTRATASNGQLLDQNISVSGRKAYDAGHSDGYAVGQSDGYSEGYSEGVNSVNLSSAWIRTTSVAVADNDSRKDCANIYLTISANNGKQKNIDISKVPMWMVYDEGRKDCIEMDATVTGVTINANGSADVHLKWSNYTRTINVDSRYVSDNHT